MIVHNRDLKEGMILGKDIYSGTVRLIEEGVVLTQKLIDKIQQFNIHYIDVANAKANEIDMELIIEQENVLKETFKRDYEESIGVAKNIISNLKDGKIESKKIDTLVNDTINNLMLETNIVLSMIENQADVNYIYRHSINTVTISMIIGMALDYDEAKLALLGKGAFLHDVGMADLKGGILDKETELSSDDMNEIKKHCEYSLNMVGKVEKEVEEIIKYHHERMDGSGYPLGLKGDAIPEMARVVAIADVYSALTSDRKYRNKYSYFDAMKIIMQETNKLLDAKILKKFLKYMPIYPINSVVILNDNVEAKVVKANQLNPFRPIVDIMENGKVNRVDLMDKTNLTKFITGVKR